MPARITFCLLLCLAGVSLPVHAAPRPVARPAAPLSALQPEAAMMAVQPAGPRSILEPLPPPPASAYRFSITGSSGSNGGALIFGALLVAGYIVRRRLLPD